MKHITTIISDIDGVILHNNALIEGAEGYIRRIQESGLKYLFLTNYPSQTRKDLKNRIANAGVDLPEEAFYTSAMATAAFLARQDGRLVRAFEQRVKPGHAAVHTALTTARAAQDEADQMRRVQQRVLDKDRFHRAGISWQLAGRARLEAHPARP